MENPLVCYRCGEEIAIKSAEEKLLQRMYLGQALCDNCTLENCTKCGGKVENPVLLNNEPYHSWCLPYSEEK